ncbi:hypothetical protein H6771_02525 [Candidatus Peribacteria bacterium]|nr:hypothetical protein [Candidatus Peribacteria bacterium]
MWQQLTSIPALLEALTAVVQQLTLQSKLSRYAGLDAIQMQRIIADPVPFLTQVHERLVHHHPLDPVQVRTIPKGEGKTRTIYLYTLRDRVRAQALSQALSPVVEATLSPSLYSYRSSHPSHRAARSVVRRYHRHLPGDTLYKTDITEYTEHLQHDLLLTQLAALGLEPAVLTALQCYLHVPLWQQGQLRYLSEGVVQGVPLMALFANLYLSDADHTLSRQVQLYRRVGDDILLIDPHPARVAHAAQWLEATTAARGLPIQPEKTTTGPLHTTAFTYLGYHFSDGILSLSQKRVVRLQATYRALCRHYALPQHALLSRLRWRILPAVHQQHLQLIQSAPHVTDLPQLRSLTRYGQRQLVRAVYGDYSPRLHRHTQALFARHSLPWPSLYRLYLQVHHGHISLHHAQSQYY